MPMKSAVQLIALLFAALLFTGCASSSGTVKNPSHLAISKSLSLDFILVETSSSVPGLDAERRALTDSLISGLNDTGLFSNVSDINTNTAPVNGIKIKTNIIEIKKV